MKRCTTHHFACSCREAEIKALLDQVRFAHSDPDSPEYQECDISPCDWCLRAEIIIECWSADQKPELQTA